MGSEKDQLAVGRHLLRKYESGLAASKDGERGTDGKEVEDAMATEAVSWLIKASMQGNDEATSLLSHCLNNEIGK